MGQVPYPRLSAVLSAQLGLVEKSVDGAVRYAPCQIRTTGGTVIDRVYVVEAGPYLEMWGVDPRRDSAKAVVPIEDVASLETSPTRLAASFANELYRVGESGMGYTVFTVVLHDGRRLPFLTGNAVDFLQWPPDVGPDDVVRVIPGAGRQSPHPHRGAGYAWCLYDGSRG